MPSTPRKRHQRADEDRISNLPDFLLDRILSFLPTKDAVATSILSKRWRRSFTWVTRLDFDDSPISLCLDRPHRIGSFPAFKMFVDNVLQACQSENLTSFRLHCGTGHTRHRSGHYCENKCFPELEPVHVYAWMCFPLARGVRELDICVRTRKPGKLPSALFSCRTLEVLKLDVIFDLQLPFSLCLPNLKELHLTMFRFPDNDSVTSLVSSCPSLEHLALDGRLLDLSPLSISSSSLRRLIICIPDWYYQSRSKLVLDVPNLEYLEHADTFPLECSIGDLNSLVEATINISFYLTTDEQLENIIKILTSLSNARRLYLMHGFVERMS